MSAPWSYEVHELSDGLSGIVYDEHGQMVADHLSEGRAALIAAAPLMLTALKSAATALDYALTYAVRDLDISERDDLQDRLLRVQAAISVATGDA